MSAYVYVMRSALTGRHSIGATSNLDERFVSRVHSSKIQSTPEAPWECVYIEVFDGMDEARKRADSLNCLEDKENGVRLLYTSRITTRYKDRSSEQ